MSDEQGFIQQTLLQLQKDVNEGFDRIEDKFGASIQDHEGRISGLEGFEKATKWMIGTFVAVLSLVAGFLSGIFNG